MNRPQKIDGYEQLFEVVDPQILLNFGINNIISIASEQAADSWASLKAKIDQKDDNLYVRNHGRNGVGNLGLAKLYKDVFKLEIKFDPTNNTKPTQILSALTGYRKNDTIYNYQVSHVFGRTKNVYMFTAPWNIVFIPKVMDPFAGHEATGAHAREFQHKFKTIIYNKYRSQIEDYNEIMAGKQNELDAWASHRSNENVKQNYLKEFALVPDPNGKPF